MYLGIHGGWDTEVVPGRKGALYCVLSKMKVYWVQGKSLFFVISPPPSCSNTEMLFSLPTLLPCVPLPELTFPPLSHPCFPFASASFTYFTLRSHSHSGQALPLPGSLP